MNSNRDSSWIFKKLRNLNSSSATILNALIEMRSRFIKEPNGVNQLRTQGGIKLLIGLIQRPNSKIVDISLSILGNCCMDKQAREEVRKLDGVTAIVRVMTCLESDSIQHRACRALANIALDLESATVMHTNNVVSHVTKFLSNTEDPLCQQTALRALRILGEQKHHRDSLVKCESIKTVAKLLPTKHDAVLQAILRTLLAFTDHCESSCAQQIDEVGGLVELVRICSEAEALVQKEPILHILANLAMHSAIRIRMALVGAIEIFAANAISNDNSSAVWKWAVTGLGHMSRELGVHGKIIQADGLKVMFGLLDRSNPVNLRRYAVTTLTCFVYDAAGMKLLVELGLVPALLDILRDEVNGRNPDHDPVTENDARQVATAKIISNRRGSSIDRCYAEGGIIGESMGPYWLGDQRPTFCISSPSYRAVCAETSESRRDSWSPDSRGSTSASPDSSPVSSPNWPGCPSPGAYPDSPASSIAMSTFLDPCYSPICEMSGTDSDSDDVTIVGLDKEVDTILNVRDTDEEILEGSGNIAAQVDLLEKFMAPDEVDDKNEGSDSHASLANCITLLLLRLAHTDPENIERKCSSLVTLTAITDLLSYVAATCPFPHRGGRILTRIMRNPHCFERLVLMQIVTHVKMVLQDVRHQPLECMHCKSKLQLSNTLLAHLMDVANSSFGIGEINHILFAGSTNQKMCAAVSAVHLLQSNKSRYHVMVKFQGLNVLLEAFQDPANPNFPDAAKAIGLFATQLFGKPSRNLPIEDPVTRHCAYTREAQNSDMELVADDEGRVEISRKRLCVESTVFHSMLGGSFSEARQSRVRVGGTSVNGLEYAVHHLYGCKANQCPSMYTAILETLLDALQLADKFLLNGLREEIADVIFTMKLTAKESLSVYEYGRLGNCPQLASYGLKYLLTDDEESVVANVVEIVKYSQESLPVVVEDIRTLLVDAIFY